MSKQTVQVTVPSQHSTARKLTVLLVAVALAAWFISDPAAAADTVSGAAGWLGSAVSAVVTFFQDLA